MTTLKEAIDNDEQITLAQEYEFYKDASPASEHCTRYQLYGIDFSGGEPWKVQGEYGADWTEVHEVGTYFNDEHDGCFYYVGHILLPDPIRPNFSEAKFICEFAAKHKLGYGYSDLLLLHLLFWGEPK